MEKSDKANFEFDEQFQIWRILTPKNTSLLLAELRNAQNLETVFVCIDFVKQKVLWDDLSFENSWAYSLSHCDSNFLYLNEFEDNDQPIVNAILGVDINTKSITWYKENCTIEDVYENGTLLINDKSIDDHYEQKLISAQDGNSLQIASEISQKTVISDIILPNTYKENSAYFNTVKNFLKEQIQIDIIKDCDYLEFNSYIIVGIYAFEGQKINNYIFLFNSSGELLHKDILGSNLKGIASDTFFISQHTLIYIKEKKEIITLFLKNES